MDQTWTEWAEAAAEVNAEVRPVSIEGDVVTRPASAVTSTVHAFLRHLRDQGLDCVPQPIDVVDGEERLTHVAGVSGGDGWYHQHDDAGLASAARLLRRIHDAGQDWVPAGDLAWGMPAVPGDDPVPCHGDPGPWNFVWSDGEAVGLIDWDLLHPAPRPDDVAYALEWFVPMRSDELALEWHHFPEAPDRRHRVQVFLEAYGDLPDFDVADGALDQDAAQIAWVRDNRARLA